MTKSVRIRENSFAIRNVTGGVSKARGLLKLQFNVGGELGQLEIKVIDELEYELILGIDFCLMFKVDACLRRGLWREKRLRAMIVTSIA